MYGVVAFFDEKTEEVIKEIWIELEEQEISFYAYEVEDRRPHITIASHRKLNMANYIEAIDYWYSDKSSIDLSFNSLGSFFNSGTLFLSPVISKELMEFHAEHHRHLHEFNDNPSSLYLPGNWIPHCTLANRLSEEKLLEAFHYCLKRNGAIKGKLNEVAILDLQDPMKAPIIYAKQLN